MSTNDEVLIPRCIERNITNKAGDAWYEYDGEQLFADDAIDRLYDRFAEMEVHDWEKLFTVKGSSGPRTKIRTKDRDDFSIAIQEAESDWVVEHGSPLTPFGKEWYGEQIGQMSVVEIAEENPRKTVVQANYNTGYKAFIGGADGKKQDILLPVRAFEQWLFHTEVVEPIFDEYHEKYPY